MIGVFDSGLGGLTVLSALLDRLPQYSYIYLGDNKRAPYGDQASKDIYNYTRAGVDFLFQQGCALIIVACNTATAVALRRLQQEHLPKHYSPRHRVLGVIRPVVEVLKETIKKEPENPGSRPSQVGIIGTTATINSKAYETELHKLGLNIEIRARACPRLVPLIESGNIMGQQAALDKVLAEYLSGFDDLDHLILGCTHYPIIEKDIKKRLPGAKLLSTPRAVSEKLIDYLGRHREIKIAVGGQRKIYFSGNIETSAANLMKYFKKLGQIKPTVTKALD